MLALVLNLKSLLPKSSRARSKYPHPDCDCIAANSLFPSPLIQIGCVGVLDCFCFVSRDNGLRPDKVSIAIANKLASSPACCNAILCDAAVARCMPSFTCSVAVVGVGVGTQLEFGIPTLVIVILGCDGSGSTSTVVGTTPTKTATNTVSASASTGANILV